MRIINLRLRAALGLGLLLLAFILLPSFIDNPVVIKKSSFEFFAGGDFSLNFVAAAPGSYDHDTGGGAFNDGTNAETADMREELEGANYACGDIVTYLQRIEVDAGATDVDQVLELSYSFLANSTGQPGVAHSDVVNIAVNYGNVENGDDGTGSNPGVGGFGLDSAIDDDRQTVGGGDTGVGGSTIVPFSEVFDPPGSIPFDYPSNDADELLLTFRVHDLDPGETIVVRIDVKLLCDPGSGPTGNLQAKLETAHVIEANGTPVMPPDAAGSGAQTIPFKKLGQLFGNGDPLINIQKTVTTSGGSCPGDETLYLTTGATVDYCYTVTNSGTADLFDVQVVDDMATPGDPGDDMIIALTGLADLDGEGDLGDLVSGGTATGTLSVTISNALGATVNKATATGENQSGGSLMDMDIATVVVCNLTCETDEIKQATNTSTQDGEINAKGLGGTAPYTFSWENNDNPGTVISTSDIVTGLGVGTYNVTVTDALGCTAVCSQTVTAGGSLPVKLSDFKAELKEEFVVLTWNTLSEVNNAGFYVEKTQREVNQFDALEFIKGQNSSRTKREYKYIDQLSPGEDFIYYRLKQVDYDGNTFYSDVRTVTRSSDPSEISIYPNPTTGVLTISIPDGDDNSKIRVYNTVGQLVDQYAVADGITSTQVDLSAFDRGIYMIHISNDYRSYLKKVILNY